MKTSESIRDISPESGEEDGLAARVEVEERSDIVNQAVVNNESRELIIVRTYVSII
jgi:hypothetical protein